MTHDPLIVRIQSLDQIWRVANIWCGLHGTASQTPLGLRGTASQTPVLQTPCTLHLHRLTHSHVSLVLCMAPVTTGTLVIASHPLDYRPSPHMALGRESLRRNLATSSIRLTHSIPTGQTHTVTARTARGTPVSART